jgi:hypothetical protein
VQSGRCAEVSPMRRDGDSYWALIEVERQLRNALSMVRGAEHLLAESSSIRAEVAEVAEDLADVVALAGASRRGVLEAWSEPEAARPAA